MTLILSRKDVQSVLEMKDCMQVVEQAFAELANGTAVLPLRNNIKPPEGLALYMPLIYRRWVHWLVRWLLFIKTILQSTTCRQQLERFFCRILRLAM
jgi:hypothetical protein